jgi:hypothetical protein
MRAHPEGAVVSFILPDAQVFATSAANVMAKFCHFIFFSRPGYRVNPGLPSIPAQSCIRLTTPSGKATQRHGNEYFIATNNTEMAVSSGARFRGEAGSSGYR